MDDTTADPGRAFDFIERIYQLDSPKCIVEAFESEAVRYGISAFALGTLPTPGARHLQPFFVSTWPQPWLDYYLDEGLAQHDPAVRYGHAGVMPATWTELQERESLTEGNRWLFGECAENGWTEGLLIPIHGPGGYRGLVGMAGANDDLSLSDRAALHMMGLYLHERLKELLAPGLVTPADALPALTEKEIECIRWLLAGKSDWEMGEILSIAEATAHWRIEQAKKKLGVKTRAQLTALAVHYGLVRP